MTFHDMFQKLVPAATQASRDSNVCGNNLYINMLDCRTSQP